jgi:hypothetical protein
LKFKLGCLYLRLTKNGTYYRFFEIMSTKIMTTVKDDNMYSVVTDEPLYVVNTDVICMMTFDLEAANDVASNYIGSSIQVIEAQDEIESYVNKLTSNQSKTLLENRTVFYLPIKSRADEFSHH